MKENKDIRMSSNVVSDDHLLYSNQVNITSSYYDLQFSFSAVGPSHDHDKELKIEQVANIAMSPQHAKDFLKILNGHIEKYESQFGRIPAMPDKLEK